MTLLKLREASMEWREIGEEVVAVDLREARYLALNPTGAVLWPHLAAGATSDRLVDLLVERFACPRETAERDLGVFLEELRQMDLLEDQ